MAEPFPAPAVGLRADNALSPPVRSPPCPPSFGASSVCNSEQDARDASVLLPSQLTHLHDPEPTQSELPR